tara:strand:+ start:3376 stop:4134 length:759 start_codon:yes stop_codon:yes gene_type:complete
MPALKMVFLLCLIVPVTSAGAQNNHFSYESISGEDRDSHDLQRDAVRKPVEVISFLGIEEGMSVLDVYAAGGYYTFILSRAVGPNGKVYAQNTEVGLSFQEGRLNITQGQAFEQKLKQGNLQNVIHKLSSVQALDVPANSLDAILMTLFLHDLYNSSPERAVGTLRHLRSLLKPGGILGITDHIGVDSGDNLHMHRMQMRQAIDVAVRAGFSIVEESDLLRNPSDDHTRHVFHPSLERNTDRFLLKLQNPTD